ncbi:hypothetical protein OK352_11090 [Microbacterium sp. MPKO10]|nr:hypothetical protein [Microbacterium sp. MPKO10]MCW4458795.1 hypothetical protein [Microbacterium sp. MPKO10]
MHLADPIGTQAVVLRRHDDLMAVADQLGNLPGLLVRPADRLGIVRVVREHDVHGLHIRALGSLSAALVEP